MLTIVSTLRNFNCQTEDWNSIQRNAVQSWLKLEPRPEILIFGNEEGVKEVCDEYGLIQIPDARVSVTNAPYMREMLKTADEMASNDSLLLVMGDNVIFQDTMRAVESLQKKEQYCGCVVRRDLAREHRGLDTKELLVEHSTPGAPNTGDYFLYSKGFWPDTMPDFIIGRGRVDNWMFDYAKAQQALIDLTPAVTTIHQTHNYSHIACNDIHDIINHFEFSYNKGLTDDVVLDLTDTRFYMNEDFEIVEKD